VQAAHDERAPSQARFASTATLYPWFPQADPAHKRAQTLQARLTRRKTVLLSAVLISWVVLLVNTVGSLVLWHLHPDVDASASLFTADCNTAGRLDSGIHLLINAFSSLLLGASNLSMQLLSAPTRREVDRAHRRKIWLDIGIPSLRNLRYIARRRQIAWAILAFASLPLPFL